MNIERILDLAKENGTKLSFLNELIGGYRGKMTDCKNGKTTLTERELTLIADYFHVTPDYLQGKTDKKNEPTEDDRLIKQIIGDSQELQKLFNVISVLSDNQLDEVLRYAQYLQEKEKSQ